MYQLRGWFASAQGRGGIEGYVRTINTLGKTRKFPQTVGSLSRNTPNHGIHVLGRIERLDDSSNHHDERERERKDWLDYILSSCLHNYALLCLPRLMRDDCGYRCSVQPSNSSYFSYKDDNGRPREEGRLGKPAKVRPTTITRVCRLDATTGLKLLRLTSWVSGSYQTRGDDRGLHAFRSPRPLHIHGFTLNRHLQSRA